MYLSDKDAEKLRKLLQEIQTESLRKPPRKHRQYNIANKALLIIIRAQRKNANTLL